MKTSFKGALAIAAYLAVTVEAASTAVLNGSVQERHSKEETVELIKTNTLTWTLKTKTVLNEDTGYQYIRWHHNLVAPIQSTDEIIFEIAF